MLILIIFGGRDGEEEEEVYWMGREQTHRYIAGNVLIRVSSS
jgi:hypothetical protein